MTTTQQGLTPPADFPRLDRLRGLDQDQRKKALAAWVTWLNTNRTDVAPDVAAELDLALDELSADSEPSVDLAQLQRKMDEWLDYAGPADEEAWASR